ncbi:preprotein translocase subunit SecD [Methanocella sp. CWC-04]|uniref:Protein-export membrane protein SecD n=1 Tax=Methanooceanicella nereidis TaxID=2052831 RepID=A0AAP2RBX1_9EURY|nr:preprotein translocase subunit SecD [Methanocella sp. CWC-04]MCD1294679.1 preprotein translocase subunit SecD [Methanocella sp. CWC-04]
MANKKESGMWSRIFTDYRVIALIICLLASAIFLAPGFTNGQFTSNLKFGLDFEGGSWIKLKLISNDTISDETLDLTKEIMGNKINAYGLKDVPINTVRDDQGNAYMLIDFAGLSYDEAMSIVGTPGRFELRIQSHGNETEHILYGDDIAGVSPPTSQDGGLGQWGVSFRLSKEGALKFQQAAVKYDILGDPEGHQVIMLLDDREFHRAPISSDLAQHLLKEPVDIMIASTGTGEEGYAQGKEVYVHMSSGSLPVNVQVISSGQVPAEQGEMFKTVVIIAAILAQIAIGAIMYYRYQEPRIILPMFLTSLFEIFILLGVASFINWEIDLPSVAGIIAVIGTGVDQLIIITDEVMTTGKSPTTKKILQRMSQAFKIIVSAAATIVIAMIPLWYMGFGSLKGFAITTILGVLIGILITRPAYGRIISEILNR